MGSNPIARSTALGLTFKQVQKYEGGANRVTAPRLKEISKIIEVPIECFFGDLPSDGARPKGEYGAAPAPDLPLSPLLMQRICSGASPTAAEILAVRQ